MPTMKSRPSSMRISFLSRAHIKRNTPNPTSIDLRRLSGRPQCSSNQGGKERWRIEGYLPKNEFRSQLEMGLARISFMDKQWADAEQRYAQVIERYAETAAAPEAVYWKGVSRYKRTNDHTVLGGVAEELGEKYPESVWAQKASVWSH